MDYAIFSSRTYILLLGGSSSQPTDPPSALDDQGGRNSHVSTIWIDYTVMHQTILGLIERGESKISATGSEDDPFLTNQSGSSWETDVDVLVASGMIQKSEGGHTVASDANIDELQRNSDAKFSTLGDAMEEVLSSNEVDWCGTPEPGIEFTDRYTEGFDGRYSNENEYLESIDDYVDCGNGHV